MEKQIPPEAIAALFERTARLLHSIGYAEGLYPAQWSALRYFSEVPPRQRTSTALARYQAMSLGPVARTVRTMVQKGLLVTVGNPATQRQHLVALTKEGRALLQKDPLVAISEIIRSIPQAEKEALATALEFVILALLAAQPHDLTPTSGEENG